jgi:hypothetical protein
MATIEQSGMRFQPIVLKIETQDEALQFLEMCDSCNNELSRKISDVFSDINKLDIPHGDYVKLEIKLDE